ETLQPPTPSKFNQVGSPIGRPPPPLPNGVFLMKVAPHPSPLPSLPRSNSFSSRRASLLSRRSCRSISSLIRLASFASSVRQHAIMDSRVILGAFPFSNTLYTPLVRPCLFSHPDFAFVGEGKQKA
ncbi:hypothetical protein GOODEAATRI_005236, partial [Goodea atripinnis]